MCVSGCCVCVSLVVDGCCLLRVVSCVACVCRLLFLVFVVVRCAWFVDSRLVCVGRCLLLVVWCLMFVTVCCCALYCGVCVVCCCGLLVVYDSLSGACW